MRQMLMAAIVLTGTLAHAQVGVPPVPAAASFQIQRGYFSFNDWEAQVDLTSSADFEVCLWGRNVDTFEGGVQIMTPRSPFRGGGSSGDQDGLVMSIPKQAGANLGCIGGLAGETIALSGAGGARVTVFVTLITAKGAAATMKATPIKRPSKH